MIYNFRIDRSNRDEVVRRLREESYLSQGWGGGEHLLDLRSPRFVKDTKARYSLGSTRIPTNLSRHLCALRDGDWLVTPHLPRDGYVAVHQVAGHFSECYQPLEVDQTHLNHRFRVRESVGLAGEIPMGVLGLGDWYSKLAWLRLPVLRIPQYRERFEDVVRLVQGQPGVPLIAAGMEEFLNDVTIQLQDRVHNLLAGMRPSGGKISFEKLCEMLLVHHGYQILRLHEYDGLGADADIICERRREDLSPFEEGVSRLYVQVKRHSGTTDAQAVSQLLEYVADTEHHGCVMTLASTFSDGAISLAEKHGIRLIARPDLEILLLQYLAERAAERAANTIGPAVTHSMT